MLHKTLYRSLNVVNVVPGRFMNQNIVQTQYLFNLHTSLEIFAYTNPKNPQFQSVYSQMLFSKALYMCIGPKTDEIDTFYIIREKDFLQFQFSHEEKIFVAIQQAYLPTICITPNYAYYEDGTLIISCFHGGLCAFDVSNGAPELIKDIKPCSSVLLSFPCYKNYFFRIETGPTFSLYRIKKFDLESSRECSTDEDQRIVYSFQFGDDCIIFCTEYSLSYQSANSSAQIQFPPDYQFDPIVDHSHVAPSDVVFLTRKGAIWRLKSDLSLTLIRKPYKVILRLFALDSTSCLLIHKSIEHIIINIENPEEKPKQSIQSTIGMTQLLVSKTPFKRVENTFQTFAPQILSVVDSQLLIFRQGMNMTLLGSIDLPDSPTGLFDIEIGDKSCFIISFKNTSKLMEIKYGEKMKFDIISSTEPFCEEGKTVGVAKIYTRRPDQHVDTIIFHFLSNRIEKIPQGKNLKTFSEQEKILFSTSSNKQMVHCTNKKMFFSGYLKRDPTKYSKFNSDIKFEPTCITLTPPDDEEAEYVVFGCKSIENVSSVEYQILFLVLSDDESERVAAITETVPFLIVSIDFSVRTADKPLGVLIGLSSGGLMIGDVDFKRQQIVTKQCLQLGSSPCFIRSFTMKGDRKIYFGLSTRMWLLENMPKSNIFRPHPYSVNSPSFMSLDHKNNCLIILSGKSLGVYRMSSSNKSNRDYSILRINIPQPIVKINILDITNHLANYASTTPFILVVCQKDIFLFDSSNTADIAKIVKFDKETITHVHYSDRRTKLPQAPVIENCYIILSTILDEDPNSNIVRIYLVNVKYITTILSDANNNNLNNPASNNNDPNSTSVSLLNLISATVVNHPIDAIAIIGDDSRLKRPQTMKKEPYIVIGFGSSILLYQLKTDNAKDRLSLLARIDKIGIRPVFIGASLEPRREMQPVLSIYVADTQRSVKNIIYNSTNFKLQVSAEEGSLRPISSTLIPYAKQGSFCGGDQLGNVFMMGISNQNSSMARIASDAADEKNIFLAKSRFTTRFSYNVGDVVTGVSTSDGDPLYPLLYSTIGGSIGCILTFDQNRVKGASQKMQMLQIVEHEIGNLLLELTKCDHVAFRNRYQMNTQICDLDIVEIFSKLAPQRKEDIIKKLKEKLSKNPKIASYSVELMEADIIKSVDHFWLW